MPLFSNSPTAPCTHCLSPRTLQINPRTIGTLIDETGSLDRGKLLWSAAAWEQLFGRTVEQLLASDVDTIRYMEQRMLFLRLTLVVGWSAEVGKLAVLGVKI